MKKVVRRIKSKLGVGGNKGTYDTVEFEKKEQKRIQRTTSFSLSVNNLADYRVFDDAPFEMQDYYLQPISLPLPTPSPTPTQTNVQTVVTKPKMTPIPTQSELSRNFNDTSSEASFKSCRSFSSRMSDEYIEMPRRDPAPESATKNAESPQQEQQSTVTLRRNSAEIEIGVEYAYVDVEREELDMQKDLANGGGSVEDEEEDLDRFADDLVAEEDSSEQSQSMDKLQSYLLSRNMKAGPESCTYIYSEIDVESKLDSRAAALENDDHVYEDLEPDETEPIRRRWNGAAGRLELSELQEATSDVEETERGVYIPNSLNQIKNETTPFLPLSDPESGATSSSSATTSTDYEEVRNNDSYNNDKTRNFQRTQAVQDLTQLEREHVYYEPIEPEEESHNGNPQTENKKTRYDDDEIAHTNPEIEEFSEETKTDNPIYDLEDSNGTADFSSPPISLNQINTAQKRLKSFSYNRNSYLLDDFGEVSVGVENVEYFCCGNENLDTQAVLLKLQQNKLDENHKSEILEQIDEMDERVARIESDIQSGWCDKRELMRKLMDEMRNLQKKFGSNFDEDIVDKQQLVSDRIKGCLKRLEN